MKKHYESNKKGDGFLSIKTFDDKQHSGYDLYRLSTGQTVPFIRKTSHLPLDWQESFRIGSFFSFNHAGIDFARQIVKESIKNNHSPFFFDEIGPMELNGKCLAAEFESLVSSKLDLIVAIRYFLVDDVIQHFNIQNYQLISL
jgi:nucleoside-triphosphatase THEP1